MTNANGRLLIYGANGYTGRLIAQEAVRRGLAPILAGRSPGAVEDLARRLGCESRVFSLGDPEQIAGHLCSVAVVAHCAGPFSATAVPMIEACLREGVHYTDITGEIDVIEAGAARHERAREAGIALMPAVGFDVVPTDCLAATLAAELPEATRLELAFAGSGGLSPGTTKTMLEGLPKGGRARIDGRIVRVPAAWKSQEIPFRSGRRWAMTIPWGDVASAYYSTGIPNIEVYLSASPAAIARARRWGRVMPLLGLWPLGAVAKWWAGRTVKGPSQHERESSRTSLWGRVSDDAGHSVEATLETPEGYTLTVLTTLAVAERLLAGGGPRGFATPSRAFGKDFICRIPGTDLQIARPSATMQPV